MNNTVVEMELILNSHSYVEFVCDWSKSIWQELFAYELVSNNTALTGFSW